MRGKAENNRIAVYVAHTENMGSVRRARNIDAIDGLYARASRLPFGAGIESPNSRAVSSHKVIAS